MPFAEPKVVTWTVGYRMIFDDRSFRWCRTRPYATKERAQQAQRTLIRHGVKAYVYQTHMLDAIGLPETYGDD